MYSIESDVVSERMRAAVSLGWSILSKKVGNNLVAINKEASMQLQYAYVLQQLIPLITFSSGDRFNIELETGINIHGRTREIDLVFSGISQQQSHTIAIEMKCYRTLSSSGGKRGATDIFMKDVYEDLQLLEQYVSEGGMSEGVSFVMNDMDRLVNPKSKSTKCWDYDISQGASFGPIDLTTPIGGKDVNISLAKSYSIDWSNNGDYWFLEIQGQSM
ncbi:conserved hypothetical protein [Vibrio crassostreae]|nr:conserved hypothetical protein [Vibrio crassostreae]CAK2947841.1 conserved hypothetical protein [Vibrio crassostreae]CAK2948715.1 conserved hypothetical protein [Vibrio crassostreae]CAK2949196.1 conserved hypothetical protein [Vibrio crassostreae]CAK2951140.1 conserved hypothetical protein [Vibrio crassostreae]